MGSIAYRKVGRFAQYLPVVTAAGVEDIEQWFIRRGLPHFVEHRDSAATIWGRAMPLLILAYRI